MFVPTDATLLNRTKKVIGVNKIQIIDKGVGGWGVEIIFPGETLFIDI